MSPANGVAEPETAPKTAETRKRFSVAERETWPKWFMPIVCAFVATLVVVVGYLFSSWMGDVAKNVEKLANGQDALRREQSDGIDDVKRAAISAASRLDAADASQRERLATLEAEGRATAAWRSATDHTLERIERKLEK